MKCVFITGFQRTGTTALGEWLALSPNVSYWGEIFHPEGVEETPRAAALRLRPAANYLRFRRECLTADELCAPAAAGSRGAEWDAYLDRLERLRPGHVHLLGVKYSSWHSLDLAWRNPSDPPFLISLAIERGLPVLHCLRRDLLAQGLSEALALATDVWHAPGGADVAPAGEPSVIVDADFVVRRMRTCVADRELLRKWLPAPLVTEIWYEDLFGLEGGDPSGAFAAIQRHFSDWPGAHASPLRKLGRDARSWIANIEALREALLATEFAEFAQRFTGPASVMLLPK